MAFPNHLTGISYVDAGGVTTRYSTYAYDATGKAIRTEHAQTDNGAPQEKFTLNYDSATQTTVVTDPVGMNEVMTFSTNLGVKSLVSKINQSDGKSVLQLFDANNNLTCRKDEENHVTTYAYSATNQRTGMTEGLTGDCTNPANVPGVSRTTTYEYLSPTLDLPRFIRRPSVAMGQTFETEMVYGDAGHPNLPTQIIQRGYTPSGTAVSRAVTLGYNAFGQMNYINGPRTPSDPGMNGVDDITTLEYHACNTGGKCGQLWKVTNALGHITTFDLYDANGRVTRKIEPNGTVTRYHYDARGRLASELYLPNTGTAGYNYTRYLSYAYTPSGKLASIYQSPGDLVHNFTYDAADDLRSVSENYYSTQWEYRYDLKGNRRQAIAKHLYTGVPTLSADYTYDIRNRLETINSGGNLTQLVFDAVGNLTQETDPNNHTTQHQYDALNRLFQTAMALSETAAYGHNVNDHVAQVQAPNGATTGLVYDDLGNLLQETSPDRGTTNYTYDAAGNVRTVMDARGVTVTYTYDALNRVIFVDYPGGTAQDVTLTYDAGPSCTAGLGRLCTAVDQSGITQYGYDAFGNLIVQSRTLNGVTFSFQYTYDAWNRLTQTTFSDGRKINYGYDEHGNTIGASITVNGATAPVFGYREYSAGNLLTYQSFGNGITDVRQHDLAGRLRQQSLGTADTRVYDYDGNGNLIQQQSLPGATGYSYDALDRMTADALHGFTYLPNGNRENDNGLMYIYAAASNRLTSVNGQNYAYDAAGNLTNRNGYTYTYNKAGRLKQVNFSFLWWTYFTGSYLYDARGLRVQKIDHNGVATAFHYDPQGRLMAETTPSGTLLRAYVWAGDMPVGQVTKDSTTGQETLVYLHTDHLNTPRLATSQNGSVVWRWEGGAFGDTPPNEDPDGDGSLTTINWRYAGQYFDAETGLHYNWNRYYDPKVGRYISSDPIGLKGGLNTYAYVENNPLRWIDPTGLEKVCKYVLGDYYDKTITELVKPELGYWKPLCILLTKPQPNFPDPIPRRMPGFPIDPNMQMDCSRTRWVVTQEAEYRTTTEKWMWGWMECTDTCTGEVTKHWMPDRPANDPPKF
jgi:RHS repeat-associated protein